VLFLNTDGTVKSQQKISDTEGGFTGTLDDNDRFGWSAASLGDLDGDGVTDLAVGAMLDDDGGTDCGSPPACDRGALWVLFLDGVAAPGYCPADFDGNGMVNAADLAQLLGAWGPNPGNPADFNGDDVVDAADLAQLLGSWGDCE
jgi:hypothetical protein